MASALKPQGLLLIGHGTRSAQGQAELRALAEQIVRLRPELIVEVGFLELVEPTIAQGLSKLVERGAGRVIVAPVLLFAAGHAKRDIPAQLAAAQQAGFALPIVDAPHLGCHRLIVELSTRRFEECVGGSEATASTALVLVGRGSFDPSAIAEMHRFSQLRAARTPVQQVFTCFYAMAEPPLEVTLRQVAELKFPRVVVQPHLLFHGDLLRELTACAERVARTVPDQEWLVTGHVGPDRLLAEAVMELANL